MNTKILGWVEGVLIALIFLVPIAGPQMTKAKRAKPPTVTEAQAQPTTPENKLTPAEEKRREDAKRLRAAAKVDASRILAADSPEEVGNWLAHGRTYKEERFSPLDKINRDTVKNLGVAWEFETGTTRGLEASPIVSNGIAFVTGNWGRVFALDAKTGERLWEYDPEVPGERARYACCDIVNRGVAVWEGSVYVGTLDGHLVKLNADTGRPDWKIQTLIDPTRPYTITGAPRIIKGMVIIGNGGAELGVRGYITAYDAKTGQQRWRFYTVPGNPALPVENPELEEAMKTWSDQGGEFKWWEIGGGGTVWDSMAYDPELDILYIGVGNGSPWNRYMRSPGGGDNLFAASIVALKPDTGRKVWHYQTVPGDTWDFTATQHMILADLTINGQPRKVLMQAPKNGFFYVIDRATGELISAEAYVAVNWARGIDKATGKPIENPDTYYKDKTAEVRPAPIGGHNWQPMSFNPQTGLVYIPVIDSSFIYIQEQPLAYRPGLWNTGLDIPALSKTINDAIAAGQALPPAKGFIRAWDPVAQKERWSVPMTGSWNSGMLSTAGGLLFAGGADGIYNAYNAETGEQLWSMDLTTGILAPSVTYMIDGEQYIMVAAGWGGAGGVADFKNPASAAVKHGTNQGRVFAFKLGGKKTVDPLPPTRTPMQGAPPALNATPEQIEAGFKTYHGICVMCHGFLAESAGVIPDLRMSTPEVFARYQEIVLGGELKANGMASFADVLKPTDVEAVRAYVLSQAQAAWQKQQAPAPAPTPVTAPEAHEPSNDGG
jgi:quinohemoprotein ethanol dehydrogenase